MLHWDTHSTTIAERACRAHGLLAIILKTQNEDELLTPWLDHHSRLVSPENIVIADNNSTSAAALNILDTASASHCVFAYSGFHNLLHDRQLFAPLYDALYKRCRFVLVLDTDEFLCAYNGEVFGANEQMLSTSTSQSLASPLIPTTWINALPSHADWFRIGTQHDLLIEGLKWGKPLVSSLAHVSGPQIHNYQWPARFFNTSLGAGLFLLHLAHVSQDRRLRINKSKLIARGFATPQDSYESIIYKWKRATIVDHTIARCAAEIETYLIPQPESRKDDQLPHDAVQININYGCHPGSKAAEHTLRHFTNTEQHYIQTILGCSHLGIPDIPRYDPHLLMHTSRQCLSEQKYEATERSLHAGRQLYPFYKDAFGDTAFQKELLRFYLSKRDFSSGLQMLKTIGPRADRLWIPLLFARAYTEAGEKQTARCLWLHVLRLGRNNIEALAQLAPLLPLKKVSPNSYSRGSDILSDLRNAYPLFRPQTIIDVGANEGDRVAGFRAEYPQVAIHAIEPVKSTCERLTKRFANDPLIKVHRLALGARRESAFITNALTSTDNYILRKPDSYDCAELIDIIPGKEFCLAESISTIDYLKIDTEGSDFQVILGFSDTLNRIKFIEVEVGMNTANQKHVAVDDLLPTMREKGFEIFGIYDQVMEFTESLALRRANFVLVNVRSMLIESSSLLVGGSACLPQELLSVLDEIPADNF